MRFACAVVVAAAGNAHAVFLRGAQQPRGLLGGELGVIRLQRPDAECLCRFDQLDELRLGIVVLHRVRQHRHAARGDDRFHSLRNGDAALRQIVRLALAEEFFKPLLHGGDVALAHQMLAEVRAAKHGIRVFLAQLRDGNVEPVALEHGGDLLVALVPLGLHPVEHRAQLGRGGVDEVAEDVDVVVAVVRGYLDPRHDLHAELRSGAHRLRHAGDAVVVGDAHGGKAERSRLFHGGARRIRAVRGGGVDMQVNAVHGWVRFLFAKISGSSGLPVVAAVILAVVLAIRVLSAVRILTAAALSVAAVSAAVGGVFGAVAVLVPAGLAVLAEPDEQNDLSDKGDEVQEVPRAAAADVVQTPPADAESRQEHADVPEREKQRSKAAVKVAGYRREYRAHGPVEQREVPVLAAPRAAGKADVLLEYGLDRFLKTHK